MNDALIWYTGLTSNVDYLFIYCICELAKQSFCVEWYECSGNKTCLWFDVKNLNLNETIAQKAVKNHMCWLQSVVTWKCKNHIFDCSTKSLPNLFRHCDVLPGEKKNNQPKGILLDRYISHRLWYWKRRKWN